MLGAVFTVLTGVTSVMETIVTGRKQGKRKKELAVDISKEIIDQLAQKGVLPASLPPDELGEMIDQVVAQQNQTGWSSLATVSTITLSFDQLLTLLAMKQAGKPEPTPAPAPPQS